MFEYELERVILGAAAVFWLARSWYLNRQLNEAREKLARLLERFPGIRESLYESERSLKQEHGARQGQHKAQEMKHCSKGCIRWAAE